MNISTLKNGLMHLRIGSSLNTYESSESPHNQVFDPHSGLIKIGSLMHHSGEMKAGLSIPSSNYLLVFVCHH